MAKERNLPSTAGRGGDFRIEGQIQREQPECQPGEVKLAAYVFDKAGMLLGSDELDSKGNYDVQVKLAQPADVELVVGPANQAQQVRLSSAYRKKFAANEWKGKGTQFRVKFDAVLPLDVWRPWWPVRICVSGHVRKIHSDDGVTDICPVPFVKVEIFDVDREPCFWPPLRKWWELLLDKPVFRIPELLKDPPFPPKPFPGPDPLPDFEPGPFAGSRAGTGSLGEADETPGPQLLSRRLAATGFSNPIEAITINPQPEPPGIPRTAFTRVGEANLMDANVAARFDRLTLTSKIAPWLIFPRCFYSTAELCETLTDCNGYFSCCFNWWPLHFRRGRLKFDSRPDIIVKVTQVIDGVPTVIYLDPYTSTRWNVTNAHIDLFLDNEEVVCGHGNCYTPLPGSPVFLTRIGDDEVYKINQTSGLYNQAPLVNVAYGKSLLVYAQFGDDLTSGTPARYYRLSHARLGSTDFTPINAPLGDTRVAKGTLFSESHTLGPKTVNGVGALYEVRDFTNYYWYNPDWVGTWNSRLAEEDTGIYVLRLEVFDQNGAKLTSAMGVDYRDGTVAPPAILPAMIDRCDLVIRLDNKAPELDLTIPAVLNECGVIPWTPALSLDFQVQVSQENNRLRSWGLYYTKGVNPAIHFLASGVSNTGLPGSINQTVAGGSAAPPPGTGMLNNLDSTCAFALKLYAWPHIRNGRHFVYYREQMKAIAVEKCPPCPPCP